LESAGHVTMRCGGLEDVLLLPSAVEEELAVPALEEELPGLVAGCHWKKIGGG
jgi:hypothetical protein